MANDYYDFNPSATTWALMLTGVVLFTVGLCVLLIWAIARAEASSVAIRAADAERDAVAGPAGSQATATEGRSRPAAAAPKARPA
jgi:hypothetical protein